MFNPLNLITKFIKSSNQKELDRIGKIVEKINLHEEDLKNLNDNDFPKKTNEFKNQLKNDIKNAEVDRQYSQMMFKSSDDDLNNLPISFSDLNFKIDHLVE